MFDANLGTILYAKTITLLATIAVVVVWLTYYCYRLKQKSKMIWGTYHASYIAYSCCIIAWIVSNTYFHTNWLVKFGTDRAIFMAELANISASLAFVFAYYFSCQLSAEQRKGTIYLWQRLIFITIAAYSIIINSQSNLTVKHVDIVGPSEFIIEFGPHTPYFFGAMLCSVILTLFNLVAMRTNSSKLTLAKTNYMIAGILVYMLSTLAIQVGLTFFLQDFSLTWLPPALSISEMLFVGYALLTSRFYSVEYLAYLCLNTLMVCGVLTIPLGMVFMLLTDNSQWLFVIPFCALIGVTWAPLYKNVSRYAALLIYGNRQTPVEQILALEEDFKLSIDDAMRRLGELLQIPSDKLRLVSSNHSEAVYARYLSSKQTALVFDELFEKLDNKVTEKSSVKALYDKMSANNTALVMPLFGHGKSVTHLLISPHKINNQMFSHEEISALQTLLTRIQSIIEADRRIHQSRALANSIAHEMRNPLSQVQLCFEMLKKHVEHQAPAQQIKQDIESGQAAIQRGRQLIDIILREVSDSSPEHEPVTMTSIHKAVDQAVSQYGFENEKVVERIHLPQQDDFVVKLNETLFNFVIFNLIRNAIYYFDSYPNSQIKITTQTGTYENILIFKDTGPGIDETIADKIFDDFFSYQKSGGSGLGLGYCQRVMRSFGGRIECKSRLGEFTEFHLSFPIVPNAPQADSLRTPYFDDWPSNQTATEDNSFPSPVVNSLSSHNSTPTVLIVDDKEIQRTLVKLYLDQLGISSLQANNGESAVNIVKTHSIDLILMDIQMPVMNGFEASKIIKAHFPAIPIIALSGESGNHELKMISLLMDGRLEKPTSLPALQDLIRHWFSKNVLSNTEYQ
ncbi:hybrid sensor histidine kinase/response regulator [Vibrio metschnikovii]|uniref:histidine kinase n=1 Tax=bacterium 19MO02SH05 TaxID=2920696 RepID=A0AAU6TK43_UNCXX|nr:hybrid sensor histidine kinase/response regulator [Vibrio metschnikovii]EKO3593099.1 hybrid sensor histidine kinase/response regulator [Vibrio metschnikovii]EKO3622331.1 hybrid sensor histidine kinase/response regulator [Vibrio metschnikovii]EKO3625497.1 hybrid sensor histidine kinase/response regulator [Vibrio metschnikovii]EKO3625978.1 hybrid sensor histidine kinase/response regulator [Vibrio metschnikovii]